MDYRKITVPFLDNKKIKKEADLFRKKFWGNSIPVDIEAIIELKLKIDIVPVPGLERLCDVDALISSNWKYVYVDYDRFLDERYTNRLRFSLAHEVGHFVLHKKIWNSFNIKEFDDFYRLIEDIPQKMYDRLEIQARKFADYLLIPREKLLFERKKALKELSELLPLEKIKRDKLNPYLAKPISKVFGVSEEVAEIALNILDNEKYSKLKKSSLNS